MNRDAVAFIEGVRQTYGRVVALDGLDLAIPAGVVAGLIGPDGVGKSTLMSLLAGARVIQQGRVEALGGDMASVAHRNAVCPRIAYMPQGLGKNLYADLTVRENIAFFSRLFGQNARERARRIGQLAEATGLSPFLDRPAKKLSGGMKQKLGLCCCLIHDPDFLILDEPTTGVDPLSRRQFWELIARMRAQRPGMSVLVATAYMEEAERFDWLAVMEGGRALASGSPPQLKAHVGAATLEETFIALSSGASSHPSLKIRPRPHSDAAPIISAHNLTCRFGAFTAVDRVSFDIGRGEIFGFVGSNGCGKTTTMKMLTGLIAPTEGEALLFGEPLQAGDMRARYRVGYMSQSFSLYSELTVKQNLTLHARLYHLNATKARTRIEELTREFGLADRLDQEAGNLPLGVRQRLSLAVAIVHEPELLILDEPTSGVDPLARDQFWEALIRLSREQGVTIFISTHFMNEAARCDRIALMDSGRVLACAAPAEIVRARRAATLEDAFIASLEEANPERATPPVEPAAALSAPPPASGYSLRRLMAYAIRESLELMRDPIRLGFSLFGTALLMLVFGFGVSTDVNNLTFAVLDRDRTPESRAYLEEMRGSAYFVEQPELVDYADLEHRMRAGSIKAAIEIPPNFGRNLERGDPVEVSAWIDGAMPFRAETIRGYLTGMHALYLTDPAIRTTPAPKPAAADIELRFKYNQDFDSIYAMAPATMAMMLGLFPAILMALGIVREKELGSIVNLYVTPVKRLEFLIGKQAPYVGVALINFTILFAMSQFVFAVPLKAVSAAIMCA